MPTGPDAGSRRSMTGRGWAAAATGTAARTKAAMTYASVVGATRMRAPWARQPRPIDGPRQRSGSRAHSDGSGPDGIQARARRACVAEGRAPRNPSCPGAQRRAEGPREHPWGAHEASSPQASTLRRVSAKPLATQARPGAQRRAEGPREHPWGGARSVVAAGVDASASERRATRGANDGGQSPPQPKLARARSAGPKARASTRGGRTKRRRRRRRCFGE